MTDAHSHPHVIQTVGAPLPSYRSSRFHLVSTGIGDAGNITVNAQEILRSTDIVFGTSSLLEKFADLLKGKELHDAGHGLFMDLIRRDYPAEKADAMEAEARQIIRHAAEHGKRIAVIDYGDSMIFGPQAGFIQEFRDLNPVVIPGVSSFNAANAALACDVMNGSTSRSVILAAAYDARENYDGTDTLERLAQTGSTLVFFAMRSRFVQLTEQLKRVLPGSTPLAVVCHAGRSQQHTVVLATLDTAVTALQGREVPFEHLVYVGDFLSY